MRITTIALITMSLAVAAPVNASDLISLSVIPCGKVGSAGGLGAGTDLKRVVVDTARYPKALCNDGSPGVSLVCTYETFMQRDYEVKDLAFWKGTHDESCLAYHTTVMPGTQWRCTDGTHVMQHHITTPMFVGQDLQDELLSSNFVEDGFGTLVDFGTAVETQLLALETLDATAEEGSASTSVVLRKPGTFGPKCRSHESLNDREDYLETKVEVGAIRYSYHDAVWNWLTGTTPQNVVRHFDQPGKAPDCP